MTINSKRFYQQLESAFLAVEQQLEGKPRLYIHINRGFDGNLQIGLQLNDDHYPHKVEVEGRDLQMLVDEYAHRAGFRAMQETLQIGRAKPAVEAEAVEVPVPAPASLDDEIPF